MSDLSKQVNIGKELEAKLNKAGINSYEELLEIGTQQAFLKIKSIYNDCCLNMLFAIEGAIQGIRWHNLSKEKKEELKDFFNFIISK